jgi:two-component system sensor histidine kinase MtrB
VTLTFALGAALLSAVLSSITYGLTRENVVSQREEVVVTGALQNATKLAEQVGSDPQPDPTTINDTIRSLPSGQGSQPLVRTGDVWSSLSTFTFSQEHIPPALLATVAEGKAARMRTVVNGDPVLIVGVPLPDTDAAYFEQGSLRDQESALEGLGFGLLGASALTTLAGGLLGFWAARRVIRPLIEAGNAAHAIAGGRLDTRLPQGTDRDLDRLVVPFNDMAQALETRLERDARFASEVSHELRSPLMTLAASVEVLENVRDAIPDRAKTALDLLSADVDRFQQLVEDLLEISRFDSGAIKLHLEDVLVSEMVIQAVSVLGGRGVPVRYDDDVSDLIVRVDKRRFARVVANLIDNARKYAFGASAVTIERAGGRVQVAVEDHGPGIPEEERDIIFDRFSRGSEGGKRATDSGVGLGLALVDEHVRLHGGRVWAEARRDDEAGARFVVELPIVDILEQLPVSAAEPVPVPT